MSYCKICGKPNCKEHTFLIPKAIKLKEFQGSSPPEIFVGRYNYPNINIGILSPIEHGNTELLASPEEWHKNKLQIPNIVQLRNKLIYGRTKGHIKNSQTNKQFRNTMQEVALTHKSISTEFKLKKPVTAHKEKDHKAPLITNAAQIEKVRLQENPKVLRKVDYLTSDTDAKSVDAILELDKSKVKSSHIMKILSAGLLGRKTWRKLVPTRWSITAVDDTISKNRLKRIRYLPELNEIQVHTSEYLGNHYEFILLPGQWNFEVIEKGLTGGEWQDHETFFPRKQYAYSVTGAYYANRLAVCEYLEKIKHQATVLVFREIRPEYNTPLGVGILREASRQAFLNRPQKYATMQDAFNSIQNRLKQPITNYTNKSEILKDYGKQKTLKNFF
jgi:hypothetical protein